VDCTAAAAAAAPEVCMARRAEAYGGGLKRKGGGMHGDKRAKIGLRTRQGRTERPTHPPFFLSAAPLP
jgi:hypothetical protein